MATIDQIDQTIQYLLDSYPQFKPRGEGFIGNWHRRFANTPALVLRNAAEAHVDNSRYFPTVAEIVERIPQAQTAQIREAADPSRLYERRLQLQLMACEGQIDKNAWVELAEEYEAAGMPYNAHTIRECYLRAAETLGTISPDDVKAALARILARLEGMEKAEGRTA